MVSKYDLPTGQVPRYLQGRTYPLLAVQLPLHHIRGKGRDHGSSGASMSTITGILGGLPYVGGFRWVLLCFGSVFPDVSENLEPLCRPPHAVRTDHREIPPSFHGSPPEHTYTVDHRGRQLHHLVIQAAGSATYFFGSYFSLIVLVQSSSIQG